NPCALPYLRSKIWPGVDSRFCGLAQPEHSPGTIDLSGGLPGVRATGRRIGMAASEHGGLSAADRHVPSLRFLWVRDGVWSGLCHASRTASRSHEGCYPDAELDCERGLRSPDPFLCCA